jgi:hypothetical protein
MSSRYSKHLMSSVMTITFFFDSPTAIGDNCPTNAAYSRSLAPPNHENSTLSRSILFTRLRHVQKVNGDVL